MSKPHLHFHAEVALHLSSAVRMFCWHNVATARQPCRESVLQVTLAILGLETLRDADPTNALRAGVELACGHDAPLVDRLHAPDQLLGAFLINKGPIDVDLRMPHWLLDSNEHTVVKGCLGKGGAYHKSTCFENDPFLKLKNKQRI